MARHRPGYPENWKAFSREIRLVRAGGRCECEGECGLHRTHPGPRRCTERHGQPAQWASGWVVLTTAHLNALGGPCRCEPLCAIPEHVKAMCNRCHLRYDVKLHVKHALDRRRAGAVIAELPLFPSIGRLRPVERVDAREEFV